jgi:predicted TIM-barrel fold metal-dependent hydrolase
VGSCQGRRADLPDGKGDRRIAPLYPIAEMLRQMAEAGVEKVGARPMFLDRIACDFPDLKMIGAHTGWPWVDELLSVCYIVGEHLVWR